MRVVSSTIQWKVIWLDMSIRVLGVGNMYVLGRLLEHGCAFQVSERRCATAVHESVVGR